MMYDTDEEYLVLKVLGQQVADSWDRVGGLIELSMPPLVNPEDRSLLMSKVLYSILIGELDVWISYDKDKNDRAVFSTRVQVEPVTRIRDLLVYSFTALSKDLRVWEMEKIFEVLSKYARAMGCNSIIAYSDNDKVVDFLASQGADVSYKLIKFEV